MVRFEDTPGTAGPIVLDLEDAESRMRQAAPNTGGRTDARDARSIGDLFRELGDESSRLLRGEAQLVKAELREKIEVYERNAVRLAIGSVLMAGAFLVFLIALNRGLTVLMVAAGIDLDIAYWLAPLLLAALTAVTGWILVGAARRAMGTEGFALRQTTETVREEADWAKRELREVRRG